MKAISLWQPWASLWIAPDAKIHETRSWPTKHRDLLAVHAAKRRPALLEDSQAANEALAVLPAYAMPLGAIIAVITLEDCQPTEIAVLKTTYRDRLFGNWSPGRFAWRRGPIVHVLPQPVPCRGFQGIWNLDTKVEQAVRAQMQREAA